MANKSELDVVVKGKDELSPELNRMSSQVIRFVGAISASLAAIRIGSEPVVQAVRYERELANVQKTTNFTRKEIGKLSDSLLEMSKNVDISAKDLATISAAAGQMGLGRFGVEGVVDFTDSVSRMASVLDITAEEAGENIGKIINIFRVPLRNIENAVSSFNQVANNSTAKGEELLDVVRRIGDAAGSLRLDQAIGLAATGLDFGISPEVVGTSMSNIFANMRMKAEALGRLLGISAENFISILQKDGVNALQMVLEKLRTLRPQVQQEAISKLFGGGRISSLVNKMLQDTNNEVMTRALKNAEQGFQEGTSAIVEQTTVLQTAQAQATMLLNTLSAISMKAVLGDMGTGSSMLADMAYAALQFREALNTPGVQASFDAIYRSVGDMVGAVADAVKWVAQLNVNWENFITLGKFWLSLKLAGWFGDLALKATGLSSALKDTAAAKTAADAAAASGTAQVTAAANQTNTALKASRASQLLGLSELEVAYKKYAATAIQQEQLVRQERQRTAALQKAQAAQDAADRGVTKARGAQQGRGVEVTDINVRLGQLQKQKAAQEAAIEAARQASIQRSMQNDAAIRLQIETTYQQQLAAIKGRGAVAARAALDAERANQERQADAANQRSLAAVERYWAQRKAVDLAGVNASIQAQQAALMAAYGKFDAATNTLNARQGAASAAAAGTAQATAMLAATTATMGASAARVGIFTQAVNVATLAFRGFVGFVSAAGGILMRAFGWIGLIYTIADAFGIIDRLGGAFSVLAEKIGLVSKAEREKALQAETTRKLQEAEIRRLDELAEKYDKLRDKATGEVGAAQVQSLANRMASDVAPETRQQAANEVATILAGAQAEIDAATLRGRATLDKRMGERTAELKAKAEEIARLEQDIARATQRYGESSPTITGLKGILAEQRQELAAIQSQADAVRKTIGDIPASTGMAQSSIQRTQQLVAGMFSEQSAGAFQQFVQPLVEAETKAKELRDQYKQLAQDAATSENAQKADAEQRRSSADAVMADLTAQNVLVNNLRKNLGDMVQQIISTPGIPDAVKQSMLDLSFYAGLTKEQVAGIAQAINALKQAGTGFTAATAGIAARPPATGQGEFKVKPAAGAENEAKRAARARLALERERIKQENALRQEGIEQQLAIEQRMYDQGLVSVASYYDSRRKLQLESNSMEIQMLKEQLKEVEKESKSATKASEKMRFEQQGVQLQGEIKVLEAKQKAIRDQNAEEQRRAAQEYQKLQLSTMNQLYTSLVSSGSMKEIYQSRLDELRLIQKENMQRMGVEMSDAMREAFDRSLQFQAYADTLAPLTTQIDLAQNKLSMFSRQLQVMQSTGSITAAEYEKAFSGAAQRTAAQLEKVLAQQVAYLKTIEHLKDTAPLVWEQQVQKIMETRLAITELNAELNKTAIGVNKSIGDSLAEGLGKLEPTLDSLKTTVLTFMRDIAQTMQKEFGKALAEKIMKSALGGDSAGGIGGWVQKMIQGDTADVTGAATKAMQPGASPATPLFVTDTNQIGEDILGTSAGLPMYVHVVNQEGSGIPGLEGMTSGIDGIKKSTGTMKDGIGIDASASSEFTGQLVSGVQAGLSGLGSLIGGGFGNLVSTLTSLFSSLMSAITSSSFGGGGGFFSLFGLAHGGGVAGRTTQSRSNVPLSAFRNATRYHNGGVAGLKPNEVPTILERGETIRTEAQEAALQRQLAGVGGGAGGEMSIKNVLVLDPSLIPDAMSSSSGEKVTMAHISKNAATIRQLLR